MPLVVEALALELIRCQGLFCVEQHHGEIARLVMLHGFACQAKSCACDDKSMYIRASLIARMKKRSSNIQI